MRARLAGSRARNRVVARLVSDACAPRTVWRPARNSYRNDRRTIRPVGHQQLQNTVRHYIGAIMRRVVEQKADLPFAQHPDDIRRAHHGTDASDPLLREPRK